MVLRVLGPGGAGEHRGSGPWGPAGQRVREIARVGLMGLVVYSLMLLLCLLVHLGLRGPVETFGPDGMWRPLAYTFGVVWPIGTGVVLVGRSERLVQLARGSGGGGCAGVLRRWWS